MPMDDTDRNGVASSAAGVPKEGRMPVPPQSHRCSASYGLEGLKSFLVWRSTAIRSISIAVMLVAVVFLMRMLPMEHALGVLRNGIDSLGIWGPLALGGLYILATLLFIPGWLLTLAAGALYGLALGTVIVSASSTIGAALAFLVARYFARGHVRHLLGKSPKLLAVDEAIGQQGWKIVALLRLSPAVPFNLQNYLYGVTAIRFWPCVLVSWIFMLPGTFMYVYMGSLGHAFAAGRDISLAEWALRGVGLLATVGVTVYIARLARNAIQQHTSIEPGERTSERYPSTGRQWTFNDRITLALGYTRHAYARRGVGALCGLGICATGYDPSGCRTFAGRTTGFFRA